MKSDTVYWRGDTLTYRHKLSYNNIDNKQKVGGKFYPKDFSTVPLLPTKVSPFTLLSVEVQCPLQSGGLY